MQISSSLFSSGMTAIQTGQQRVDEAGQAIAASALPVAENSQAVAATVELTEQLIQIKVGEHTAKAGVRMLRSADEVLGTLINTKA